MKYGNISSWIWLSLLSLTTIYVTTQATMLDSVTMRKVLPAYAILENADLLNSSRCRTEIDEFRNAVNNQILWGLRALDTRWCATRGISERTQSLVRRSPSLHQPLSKSHVVYRGEQTKEQYEIQESERGASTF